MLKAQKQRVAKKGTTFLSTCQMQSQDGPFNYHVFLTDHRSMIEVNGKHQKFPFESHAGFMHI